MSALIVHDLKNPVAAVIANLEFIEQSPRLNDEERESLDDAASPAIARCACWPNLLDVDGWRRVGCVLRAPTQAGRAGGAKVMAAYRLLIAPARRHDRVTINPGLERRRRRRPGDARHREPVDNSLRFTPPGGRIVSTRAELEPTSRLRHRQQRPAHSGGVATSASSTSSRRATPSSALAATSASASTSAASSPRRTAAASTSRRTPELPTQFVMSLPP